VGLAIACVGTGSLLAVVLAGGGLVALVAGLFTTVCGVGCVLPCATTVALADHPDHAGAASALIGTAQFIVGAVTAPLVGLAGTGSAVPMAATMLGAVVLGALAFTLVRPRSAAPAGGAD
jgi:MFS transporter, DHA1 family, multidrug resistance protein